MLQKQIVYSNFIPRLLAMVIDLFILSFTISPLTNLIYGGVFYFVFIDFFSLHPDINMFNVAYSSFMSEEFMEYFAKLEDLPSKMILLYTVFFISSFSLNGVYFIWFWNKYQASPGAMLLGMKIANADDFDKPTLKNFIKRYASYILCFIGIWFMFFNKQRMALHDKIANTVVIKK